MIHPCSSLQQAGSEGRARFCSSWAVPRAVPPCSSPHYGMWPKQLPGQPSIPAVQPPQPNLAASFPVTRWEVQQKAMARHWQGQGKRGRQQEWVRSMVGLFVLWFAFFFFPFTKCSFIFCVKNLWSPSFNIYKVSVLVINYRETQQGSLAAGVGVPSGAWELPMRPICPCPSSSIPGDSGDRGMNDAVGLGGGSTPVFVSVRLWHCWPPCFMGKHGWEQEARLPGAEMRRPAR